MEEEADAREPSCKSRLQTRIYHYKLFFPIGQIIFAYKTNYFQPRVPPTDEHISLHQDKLCFPIGQIIFAYRTNYFQSQKNTAASAADHLHKSLENTHHARISLETTHMTHIYHQKKKKIYAHISLEKKCCAHTSLENTHHARISLETTHVTHIYH